MKSIKTKFNLEQEVFLMYENRIEAGSVKKIRVEVNSKNTIVDYIIELKIKKDKNSGFMGVTSGVDKIVLSKSEGTLFKDKESLLQSLLN